MRLDDLSVIVPTRNEERNLPYLVASLPDEVQLVLVDCSQDQTPELALRLRPERTTVIRSQARIAAARNLGGRAASTPWLLFTDADIAFSRDYFDTLSAGFNPEMGIPEVFYGPKLSQDEHQAYYENFSRWLGRFDRIGIPAVSGSNLLLRADVFQNSGGFDPEMLVNEDTEIGFRLMRNGHKPHFDPRLVVYARDHRRLERGKLRKDFHSVTRCALIYLNLFPSLWRGRDWGYWKE